MRRHPNVYTDPWEDEGIDRGQRLADEYADPPTPRLPATPPDEE